MEARESRGRDANSDGSEEEESDGDETTSSMMDFIEPDDSSPAVGRRSRPQIIDSDSDDSNEEEDEDEDEEDEEEEEVVSTRPRQRANRSRPNRPIVLDSDSEDSAGQEESRVGNHLDTGDEHESDSSARNGGYSPLDHGDDSENDEAEPFAAAEDHPDTSDSDTTVGHHDEDDEDDEEDEGPVSRIGRSAAPRRGGEARAQRFPFHRHGGSRTKTQRERISAGQSSREQSREENSEDREEERSSSPAAGYGASDDDNAATDQDGDIEMGAKPTRGSVPEPPELLFRDAVDDFYGDEAEIQFDHPAEPAPRSRRRRRAPAQISPTQEYDPRISMMFAQHQSDLRDATARESPLYEGQRDPPRRIEAPSRSRRRAQYRLDPPTLSNRFGPNREPIVISSSARPGRAHRNRREYRV
ncbi:hypothetical protein V492_08331 [Pseudogymnoascus sp. VKM F-4246]|nr:hypothetical protein V492_08331 [Pseudogymnoascus sp. VKM F-4246]